MRHGQYKAPEYRSWNHMIQRCTNPANSRWAAYGGRGIAVCSEWRNDFSRFLKDMGPRPHGTTLDRIDKNGNYEPSNCRWATPKQQQNNMRSNQLITAHGETLSISEWAEVLGINRSTLSKRLDRGWTPMEALTPPLWTKEAKN